MTSAAERFLIDFHARHAGATTVALGDIHVRCADAAYASSYHALAAHVPHDAARILDLACGDGHLLALLACERPQAELTGVDMSPGELAAAAARLRGSAALHEARAQALPFRDGAFDAVTCHMALMLMEEPAAVLAELRRVTRAGGSLTAVIGAGLPASPGLDAWRAVVLPRVKASGNAVAIGDGRWRQPQALHDLLAQAGCGGIEQQAIEGETRLSPPALWEQLLLMYDAHFLDEATRFSLRAPFIEAVAPHAQADGLVPYPVAWRLVKARFC